MKILYEIIPPFPLAWKINRKIVGGGTIEVTPDNSKFWNDQSVTIKAIPSPGYEFKTWRGSNVSSTDTLNININSDLNLIAMFSPVQTARVVIYGFNNPAHELQVKNSFLQGYFDSCGNVFSDIITIKNITDLDQIADDDGAEVFICSYGGGVNLPYYIHTEQILYPIQWFMPSGSNGQIEAWNFRKNGSTYELPAIIVTSCGTLVNEAATNIETFTINPFGGIAQSFSNGYAAGIYIAAADTFFNKDYSAVRYYLRKGKVFDRTNGYGRILYSDLTSAANVNEYLANVAIDPLYYRKLDSYYTKYSYLY